MSHLSRNIFNVEEPQSYNCTVWSYRVNHSVLLVRADKDDKTLYFIFNGVLYFEGPVRWEDVKFCIGETDECIKLLHKRGFKDVPKNVLLDRFRLFVIELPDSEVVKILAFKDADMTTEIPPDFPWLIKQLTD